jgi:superfamily II DNA or RNA helicase
VITLRYEKGTLVVTSNFKLPHTVWDTRTGVYRCLPLFYKDVIEYLKLSRLEYEDDVLDLPPMPQLTEALKLRDYQSAALQRWMRTNQGVLVLPTGAGKTIIAIKAIATLNVPTLVVVPTLELVKQWQRELDTRLGIETFVAPYRLGLTATYEREDGRHTDLERLVGGKIYEISVEKLTGKHLAEYTTRKIVTDLTDTERVEYERYYVVFTDFLKTKRIVLRTPRDFQRFVMRTGRDPKAREALLARNRARQIALNSRTKLDALAEILTEHPGERTIIFTEHNSLVYAISREFLIPAITHTTPKEERAEILEKFRTGQYGRIVTSKVLEEGIDVPEASVGVILSGSGSRREYKQRLGRILRKKEGKLAILYEIVSKGTTEIGIARRRKSTETEQS